MTSKKAKNIWDLPNFDRYAKLLNSKTFYRNGNEINVSANKKKKFINHYFSLHPETNKLSMKAFDKFINKTYNYSLNKFYDREQSAEERLRKKENAEIYKDPYKKNKPKKN